MTESHPSTSTAQNSKSLSCKLIDINILMSATGSEKHKNALRVISREYKLLKEDVGIRKASILGLLELVEDQYELAATGQTAAEMVQPYIRGYLVFCYFVSLRVMTRYDGFERFVEEASKDFKIYVQLFSIYESWDEMIQIRRYVEDWIGDKLPFDLRVLLKWLKEYSIYEKNSGSSYNNNLHTHHSITGNEYEEIDELEDFKNRFPSMRVSNSTERIENYKESINDSMAGLKIKDTTKEPVIHDSQSIPIRPLPTVASNVNKTQPIISQAPYLPARDSNSTSSYNSKRKSNIITERPPIPQTIPQELVESREQIKNSFGHQNSNHNLTPHSNNDSSLYTTTSSSPIKSEPFNRSRFTSPESANKFIESSSPNNTSQPSYTKLPYNYTQVNGHNAFPVNTQTLQPMINGNKVQNYSRSSNVVSNEHGKTNGKVRSPMAINKPLGHPTSSNGYSKTHNGVNGNSVMPNTPEAYMKNNAICGLRNFGSSCYINATLQLLFGLIQFKSIFTNSRYHEYISPKFIGGFASPEPSLLSVAISGIIRTFQTHGSFAISPSKFLRIASKLKPDFNIPNEQQDAQEFLLFVLDRLHEELSTKEDVVSVGQEDAYTKWIHDQLRTEGKSPISDLFQGHLQNKLVCNRCGYESVTYSPFTILSLPIPRYQVRTGTGSATPVDVSDCLRYYIKDEVLSGENAWKCPKCPKDVRRTDKFSLRKKEVHGDSTKKLSFVKLPTVLLIHLSRFASTTDKLDTNIIYPLELTFNGGVSYKLSGIINHTGTLKSGHYTSLVNKSTYHQKSIDETQFTNKDNLYQPYWCFFDDDLVQPGVTHGNLNSNVGPIIPKMASKEAYVLCYERVT